MGKAVSESKLNVDGMDEEIGVAPINLDDYNVGIGMKKISGSDESKEEEEEEEK